MNFRHVIEQLSESNSADQLMAYHSASQLRLTLIKVTYCAQPAVGFRPGCADISTLTIACNSTHLLHNFGYFCTYKCLSPAFLLHL